LEQVESRTLFTTDIWGAAPSLVSLDDLDTNSPLLLGTGQTVAVIDTGIDYTHPSLGGGFGAGYKVIGGYDFYEQDTDPLDTDGHGTAVAGVIAASKFEVGGFTYRGIAPGAKLVALRIAQNTTDVPLERIEDALQWVITNRAEFDIGIVNLSFGYGRFDSSFSDATLGDELTALRNLGVVFVTSAGNGGTDDGFGITAPGADTTAISVGSVSGSDVISEFSQRSSNMAILAVGEGVRSTALAGTYTTVDGTSFAAPAVAGTIAIMRQIEPDFTVADIRSMLRTAMPRNYDGDQEIGATTGLTFPRLDVAQAAALAQLRAFGSEDVQNHIGQAGNENDQAFDSFGVMHFVYYDNDAKTMKYATKSPGGMWSVPSVIDNAVLNVGTEFSLKLDSFGAPRLAYLDSPNGDLKFARFTGAAWSIEILDSQGVAGLYPSLAIDSHDRMWVAYLRKSNWDLRVMNFNGTRWSRQTIDTDGQVGYAANVALDGNERPGIVYSNGTYKQLKYAHRNANDQWVLDVIEQSGFGVSYLSLAYDFNNRPSVSYYEVETADLKFAEYSGSAWTHTRIASRGATGLYTNLQINGAGIAQIFYWDRRSNSINRATREDARWTITRIESDAGKFLTVGISTSTGKYVAIGNRVNRLHIVETN
jgi:subtilisin family serine protease